jgi:2'-5' RNA ligase
VGALPSGSPHFLATPSVACKIPKQVVDHRSHLVHRLAGSYVPREHLGHMRLHCTLHTSPVGRIGHDLGSPLLSMCRKIPSF